MVRLGRHRGGGTRAFSGRNEGTSAPASVTLSAAKTNASSGPSASAKAASLSSEDFSPIRESPDVLSDASSPLLVSIITSSSTSASARPAGCGGNGTVCIRTSTFVARKRDHRIVQSLERENAARVASRSALVFVTPSSQHKSTRSTSLFPDFASPRATEPRAYAPATRPAPTRARTSASRSEGSEGSEEDRPSHATMATRAASSAAASHWSSGAPRARADPDPKAETKQAVSSGTTAPVSGSRRRLFRLSARATPARASCSSARAPGDGPPARTRQRANRTAAALASASPGRVVSASLSASSSPDAKPTSARHSSARTSAAAKGGDANRRVTELETRGPRLSV